MCVFFDLMKTLSHFVFSFLLLFFTAGCDASDGLNSGTASVGAPTHSLTIVSQDGASHSFLVELAADDASRAKGLMFRREMAPDAGMLFDFEQDRLVSMWMKNTYIPLDMLFIKSDGTIATIAQMTEPHSLKSIPSRVSVRAVLELNGGVAAQLGIEAGDRVIHELFGPF